MPADNRVMTRYAIVLNSDSSYAQLRMVESAAASLSADGYVTYVASPEDPLIADVYQDVSDPADFQKIVAQLGSTITAADELVIYATGSGTGEGFCVDGDCAGGAELAAGLDALPYRHRTVIMNQGAGGSWQRFFADDPETLFTSAGADLDGVESQKYAERLWVNSGLLLLQGQDANGDGAISLSERLAYAEKAIGPRSWSKETSAVREVATEEELAAVLEEARQRGVRHAVIGFSAPWCGACHEFRPEFERQAAEAPDDVIFLWTENEELSENRGFTKFPTFIGHNSDGGWIEIEDRSDLAGAAKASVTREVRALTRAEETGDLTGLIRAVSSENLPVRLRAVQSLGRIAKEQGAEAARDVLPALITALDDPELKVREAAVGALKGLGCEARAAIPDLIVAASRHQELTSAAEDARERIGPASTKEGAELIRLLWSRDEGVSTAAAHELGRMGPDAVGAVGALEWILDLSTRRRDGFDVRLAAIEALGNIGPGAASAVPRLIQALGDPGASIRSAAAEALGKIGPVAAEAIPALTRRLNDPKEYVGTAAAKALELIQ